MGPGLLESAYDAVLEKEVLDRGLTVVRQVPLSLTWKGLEVKEAYRADLIIGGRVNFGAHRFIDAIERIANGMP